VWANAVSRRFLKYFFRQTLFSDGRTCPPFKHMSRSRVSHANLTGDNLKAALLASGSIPYVMQGIRNIPGAPTGTYRDGGAVDYHLDVPYGLKGRGIVLFPHYTDRIIPGWLDKKLPWRKPSPANMADVVLVAPGPEFVARLPLGKISDRNDFYRFAGDDRGRFDYWQKVADAGRVLAEDFMEKILWKRLLQVVFVKGCSHYPNPITSGITAGIFQRSDSKPGSRLYRPGHRSGKRLFHPSDGICPRTQSPWAAWPQMPLSVCPNGSGEP